MNIRIMKQKIQKPTSTEAVKTCAQKPQRKENGYRVSPHRTEGNLYSKAVKKRLFDSLTTINDHT